MQQSEAVGTAPTSAMSLWRRLPAGPAGLTRPCVQCGLYLSTDQDGPVALLLRGPEANTGAASPSRLPATQPDRAQGIIDEIRRLSIELNVYRGHVISFSGDEIFGRHRTALLSFVDRPQVHRDEVVLPRGASGRD